MGETLHILQQWIKQVKPGGPAVPFKAMIVFLLLLYIYFYVLLIFYLKNLKNKQKNRYFDITANFEY